MPLGVGTSSHGDRARWILSHLGYISDEGNGKFNLRHGYISDLFRAIVTKEDVSNYKPAPDTFNLTKHMIGNPFVCFVIEDSPLGIIAAKNAGMYAIAYLTKEHTQEDFNHADLIISSFNELSYEVLNNIAKEYTQ